MSNMDASAVQADVERLLSAVSLPLSSFAGKHRLDSVTQADAETLLARFVVTWLLSNGLITVADESAFEEWLAVDLYEPFASDVAAHLREAVARRARFDAMAAASIIHRTAP